MTIKALLAFSVTAKATTGVVGASYRWKVPVTGASKTRTFVMSGKFPPGLDLDETTGTLSGTPLKNGSYKFKVWVFGDPGTIISKTFTVKIR